MTPKSVQIESAELLERAAKEAEQSGQSLNELTTEALERELARRSFQRLMRSTDIRRRGMSDADVDERVERSIREYRTEQRSR
jgi:hypothetical protein